MGWLSTTVLVTVNGHNIKHYIERGYKCNKGDKIFRIIRNKNKLPDKDFLLYIKNQSIKYFDNGYNVFRFYIDNNTFRYY